MPQFFINKENVQDDRIFITNPSDVNHIKNVLRHKKKDRLIFVADDNYVYESEILSLGESIETKITDKYFSDKRLKTNITLAQSIIKSQKQDFLIQKATELGVKNIIPFISKNTVVKFDSEKDKANKINRWQKIVYESAKQCKRGDLAEIKQIASFDEVLKLEGFDFKIVCSEREDNYSIKEFLSNYQEKNKAFNVLIVIGPEGGWTVEEVDKFTENNFAVVTLGKLIYRAETAATVAVSHIIYECEL